MLTLHHHFSTRIFLDAKPAFSATASARRTGLKVAVDGPRSDAPASRKNLRPSDLAVSWTVGRKGGTHAR